MPGQPAGSSLQIQGYREEMDLETEICADTRTSLAYIPYKTPFTPISLHICSKFSGQVASFRDEKEFRAITRFLFRWSRCSR